MCVCLQKNSQKRQFLRKKWQENLDSDEKAAIFAPAKTEKRRLATIFESLKLIEYSKYILG